MDRVGRRVAIVVGLAMAFGRMARAVCRDDGGMGPGDMEADPRRDGETFGDAYRRMNREVQAGRAMMAAAGVAPGQGGGVAGDGAGR